jgi:hypothetical protein
MFNLHQQATSVHYSNPTPVCATLYQCLIYITPAPVFPLFKGLDDRVLGGVKMFGGMFVGRRIATTHMAAGEAEAQMHPPTAALEAILTPLGAGRYNLNLGQMLAGHEILLT